MSAKQKAVEQKEAKGAKEDPEDYVGSALYLLQLVQQDLNMGRKSTVWARVKRARKHLKELEDMLLPKSNKVSDDIPQGGHGRACKMAHEGTKPY